MQIKNKKLFGIFFVILSAIYFASFCVWHMSYLSESANVYDILSYVKMYLDKIINYIIPIVLSTIVLTVFLYRGVKRSILTSVLLSLSSWFYSVPYLYFYFLYNGYDSLESVTLSLISSLVISLALSASCILLVIFALWIYSLVKKTKGVKITKESIVKEISVHSLVDYLGGVNLILTVFTLVRFIIDLVTEILYTVVYFIDVGLGVTIPEILVMMADYLLLFALLICGYLIAYGVKKLCTKISPAQSEAVE